MSRKKKDEDAAVDKAKDWGRNVDRDEKKVDKHRGRDDTLGDALKDVLGDEDK